MISFILYRRNYLDVNMIIADIFWAAICKSKTAQARKFCASPFDFLHLVNFTWFQLFPFCTEQSIHTVLLSHVQLCSYCERIMHTVVGTLWTHCGGHKEGLFAQSRWHLTTIKMRNWGGRRNGFNRTVWISTHHLYKYAYKTSTTSTQTSTITI